MGKRLFVGNLSYNISEPELRDVFAQSGDVTEVKIVLDRDTGRPRGFAFVEMSTDDAAASAISDLNGRDLMGRPLTVREAEDRRGGGGGGGGGFRQSGGGGGQRRW